MKNLPYSVTVKRNGRTKVWYYQFSGDAKTAFEMAAVINGAAVSWPIRIEPGEEISATGNGGTVTLTRRNKL